MSAIQATSTKVYFAYGSNLSSTQMRARCPNAVPLGLGHLRGWHWLINERGFANIVKDPVATHAPLADSLPGVYGVLYSLPPNDEDVLDMYEGVPTAYEKEILEVDVVQDGSSGSMEATGFPEGVGSLSALVYIDYHRVKADRPRAEYVSRMNLGIEEARRDWGLPGSYIAHVMREFIRETSS
ncbi:uncharacterized protein PG998_011271 [Apiospora kogelbergensis]|uniref:gamma-glutamylcyclotransferase n=1 Tax=Apiospora kogelbergensis TaxID=1337665 RepID=A0AAW0RCC8_9PEZI